MSGAYEAQARRRPAVDTARLWSGGAATAIVAALVSIVGILIARELFGVPILAPQGDGVWGEAPVGAYAAGAVIASLLATALIHVLLVSTPRPTLFFGWITALVTIAMSLAPFTTDQAMAAKVGTGVLNLVLGLTICSLVLGSAHSAVLTARRTAPGGAW